MFRKQKKEIVLILLIFLFLLALAQRFYLLYSSSHYLDGDEAYLGLMAKHILERGEHPLFWYGLHYNGGGSWEAHLGALTLLIGGYSDYSLKYVALIISMLICFILYLWTKGNFGNRIAIITTFLYVFSVSFIEWNLKLRGHLTGVLSLLILLWLYYGFLFQEKRGNLFIMIVGLASGLAFWCMQSLIILTSLFLIFWFYHDRKLLLRWKFWLFGGMFLVGAGPVIYENLAHSFLNIRFLLCKASPLFPTRTFWQRCWLTFTHDLPALFHSDIVHNYPEKSAWWGWSGYIIALISFVLFIIILWKPLIKWLRGWWDKKYVKSEIEASEKLLFLLFYVLLFHCAFTFSKYSSMSPRYMVPILPGAFLIIAIFLEKLFYSNKTLVKSWGIIIILLWMFMGVIVTFRVANSPMVVDGFVSSPGADMMSLVAKMQEKNLKTAYSNYFLQSRIIFYSRENIIASRFRDPEGVILGSPALSLYPAYEDIVANRGGEAYVFLRNNPIRINLENYLKNNNIIYKMEGAGNYIFYYDFAPAFRHRDFTHYLYQIGYNFERLLPLL